MHSAAAAQAQALRMQQMQQHHAMYQQHLQQAQVAQVQRAQKMAAATALAAAAAAAQAAAAKQDAAEDPGEAEEDADDNVAFASYTPSRLKIGVPHPDPVCEVGLWLRGPQFWFALFHHAAAHSPNTLPNDQKRCTGRCAGS
jgi:type II secretory pathway component HofQ